MKATQVLDARRNVKKQIVSYISIMVIAMVAVSAYLGIAYPAAALRKGASDYYARFRFWDLEVVSTMLMDEEDLETLRAIPGVKAVEGAYGMKRIWRRCAPSPASKPSRAPMSSAGTCCLKTA